jgi:hypothetical protein
MSKVIAQFEDRFGEERVVHKTRRGLTIRREPTMVLKMNQVVSLMIGQRVKHFRGLRGWTLVELATRAGMHSGHPKERIWAIENATRKEGMRMGTVYALALALGVEATDLMPTVEEVASQAGVEQVELPVVIGS